MLVLPLPTRSNFPFQPGRQSPRFCRPRRALIFSQNPNFHLIPPRKSLNSESQAVDNGRGEFDTRGPVTESVSGDGVITEIEKVGKNSRRIFSRIEINAGLEAVWRLLTDYEKLADFIPGLASCELLEKKDKFAKLFQIGQQNLALGLKFYAKGIVECYEGELQSLSFGRQRDIDFRMVEGDFKVFEGKWSILEADVERYDDTSDARAFQTTLSYIVLVQPKLWLPVQLVEGRLCKEIELNLLCIREEAQKAIGDSSFSS
ncbi:hypothetical protein H6P81_004523 [Aristolochia fimbriata]|uniref:Coenzyme Q-binding protein COQ10 START domain-containing protein n=1 Tax=Aristolochia fimbriata TaxID=158543 RepID=A0AAV7FHN6_ARIFI|nr:hypothetical protein H6P81_004523 [Aristolochia fimbriata]